MEAEETVIVEEEKDFRELLSQIDFGSEGQDEVEEDVKAVVGAASGAESKREAQQEAPKESEGEGSPARVELAGREVGRDESDGDEDEDRPVDELDGMDGGKRASSLGGDGILWARIRFGRPSRHAPSSFYVPGRG
jgi:hypothetical protein